MIRYYYLLKLIKFITDNLTANGKIYDFQLLKRSKQIRYFIDFSIPRYVSRIDIWPGMQFSLLRL